MNIQDRNVKIGDYNTFYHEAGIGNKETVIFLHGSGVGVSAWGNWRFALPVLSETYHCIAPDLLGFNKSEHPVNPPKGGRQWMDKWVDQVIGLMDQLGLEKVHLVGNSMGGAVSKNLLWKHPDRFNRVVLMGSAGSVFKATESLSRAWGFYNNPTKEELIWLVKHFVTNPQILGDDLDAICEVRLKSAMDPDVRRSYESIFCDEAQQVINDTSVPMDALSKMHHRILIAHGKEDFYVPAQNSIELMDHLPNAQLHIFSHCGHWIQIEKRNSFNHLVNNFLAGLLD